MSVENKKTFKEKLILFLVVLRKYIAVLGIYTMDYFGGRKWEPSSEQKTR